MEKLGWRYEALVNNREIYSIDNYSIFIHLHDDSIGIITNDGEWHYCNMSEKSLRLYTGLLLLLREIKNNPDNFTLADYQKVKSAVVLGTQALTQALIQSGEEEWDTDLIQ